MEQLQFKIEIEADAATVFDKMLNKETYEQWTASFHEGSTYEGTWEKGTKIYFIGPDENGKKQGMVSRIKENIPNQLITIEHLGFVDGDTEITSGPAVEQWAGAIEEYAFTQQHNITTLVVRIDVGEDHKSSFEELWPLALNTLKAICEKP